MAHVIRSIKRPEKNILKEIAKHTPATLHESQGRRGALDSHIKPLFSGMRVCGPAVTAQCHPGDNLMIQAACSVAQPGDVLVVSAGNTTEQGSFGEVLATACQAKGIAGLVIDCGVRDVLAIKEKGFPVFCLGACMKGTVKETLGTVNHPITIGGVIVHPGNIICGDDDGVVLVLSVEAEKIAEEAKIREDKEAKFIKALREGANALELFGFDKVLERKGCTYSDEP